MDEKIAVQRGEDRMSKGGEKKQESTRKWNDGRGRSTPDSDDNHYSQTARTIAIAASPSADLVLGLAWPGLAFWQRSSPVQSVGRNVPPRSRFAQD